MGKTILPLLLFLAVFCGLHGICRPVDGAASGAPLRPAEEAVENLHLPEYSALPATAAPSFRQQHPGKSPRRDADDTVPFYAVLTGITEAAVILAFPGKEFNRASSPEIIRRVRRTLPARAGPQD